MANKDADFEQHSKVLMPLRLPTRQPHPLDDILTSPLGGTPTPIDSETARLHMVGKTATYIGHQLEDKGVVQIFEPIREEELPQDAEGNKADFDLPPGFVLTKAGQERGLGEPLSITPKAVKTLDPLPADELPHDAPGKKINPAGVTLKTSNGDKTSYVNEICALERELRYITNPEHIFDPQCYRKGNVNGVLINDTPEKRVTRDISFHLFYVFGTAYLKGHTDNGCFQIFYNQAEGFNIDFAPDYKTLETDAPVTRLHSAKDFDGALATLLEYLCPLGESV